MIQSSVSEHYESSGLVTRLSAALNRAGLSEKILTAADVAPLDQFHTRGLAATADLAQNFRSIKNSNVIDVGSGLGGPSRFLANTYGCRVTGVDLSQSFVDAATFLAERTGLSDKVTYRCADAMSLPFESETFDIAWTQHVAMNIENRKGFYDEVRRVLRSGGQFAIYDIVEGDGRALHFPVPWSRSQETSFLLTASNMQSVLVECGFEVISWNDSTESAVAWFVALKQSLAVTNADARLGLDVVMGSDFKQMASNLTLNFQEGRVRVIEATLRKIS